MAPARHRTLAQPRLIMAAVTCALLLCAGCAAGAETSVAPSRPSQAVGASAGSPSTAASAGSLPTAAATTRGGHGNGSGRASTPQPELAPDWPADVPVPAGLLQGSTGAAGSWSAQFLVDGSATRVRAATIDFYRTVGFAVVSGSIVHRGSRTITIAVENYDHSASRTTLVIAMSTA